MGKFDDISFYGHENEELQKEYERMFCNMTQEDKQLLIKDLCARLPYRVKCSFISSKGDVPSTIVKVDIENETVSHIPDGQTVTYFHWIESGYIKPYLRPMSSMTEEECITLSKLIPYETDAWKYTKTPVPLYIANIEHFDFFHRHHLDWRGLIPKGLAIEAPEGMY